MAVTVDYPSVVEPNLLVPNRKPRFPVMIDWNNPLTDKLFLFMLMDDRANTLRDLNRYHQNFTGFNGLLWNTVDQGRVLELNGSNDFARASFNSVWNFDVSAGFTLSAWCLTTSISGGTTFSSTNPRTLFMKGDASAGYQDSPWIRLLGGRISFGYRNSADNDWTEKRTTNEVISANEFCHIAAVHTGSDIKLYKNGISRSATTADGSMTDSSLNHNSTITIGRRENGGSSNRYWPGYVSCLHISLRPFSDSEIYDWYSDTMQILKPVG